jgi:glycosyltransferase involved in cell wall biosynthesis
MGGRVPYRLQHPPCLNVLTIIVPSYNQNRFLPQTLDSIMAQSYRPLEVIVVDGASTDGTLDTLQAYAARHPELRWVSEPDDGPASAVNKGLALARGDVAAIQSADDLYCPGAFDAVMQAFAANPECGFIIGDFQGIDADGAVTFTEASPEFSWPAYFARAFQITQSSIFFRTELGRSIGGWNGAYYSADLDFWMRLLFRTRAMHLPLVLSRYRIYGQQRTYRPEAGARIWDGYWRMIDDSADLQRAPPRVRRWARASRHLFAMRFHPTRDAWAVRRHILLGFLLFPTFWRYHSWGAWQWLPGVQRMLRLWRRHFGRSA